jgi:hypothetical protein
MRSQRRPIAVAHWRRVWPALRHVFGGRKRLIANKAHGPFLHFELRHIRDVARQSGKAVTFMPGLELAQDAVGKQGATAFQCRCHCPLTEHRSIGAAELRAVKLAPRAIFRVSVRVSYSLNPNPLCHFSPGLSSRIQDESPRQGLARRPSSRLLWDPTVLNLGRARNGTPTKRRWGSRCRQPTKSSPQDLYPPAGEETGLR